MSRRTFVILCWSFAVFFGIGFGLTFITYARYVWTDEKPAPAFAITMSLLKLAAPLVGATLTAYAGPLGKLPGTRHADS